MPAYSGLFPQISCCMRTDSLFFVSMTNFPPVNVLFTSAGRRVELLTAFRQAYKTLGLKGRVVAVDIDAPALTTQVADRLTSDSVRLAIIRI